MNANIISHLFWKNWRQLSRNSSIKSFIFLSHFIIFVSLYLMWSSTYGKNLKYNTHQEYTPLSFDVKCTTENKYQGRLICKPNDGETSESNLEVEGMTPADILLKIIGSDGILDTSSSSNNGLPSLISSMMMNGMPLLGFEDYIEFSDFVNRHLGPSAKTKMMKFTSNREKFSNLLFVRERNLVFASNNSVTRSFIEYLYSSAPSTKVIYLNHL